MTLGWTAGMLAMGLASAALGLWCERRPRELGSVRLPSTLLLALGILFVVLAAGHLVSLETGHSFAGRLAF